METAIKIFQYLEKLPQDGLINFCILLVCLFICIGQMYKAWEHRKRARGMLTYDEFLALLYKGTAL